MDAGRYQDLAGRTLISKPDFELKRDHAAHAQELLDFAASVGAIAEYIKKGIFHQHGFSDGELYKLYRHAMRNDDTRGVPWMDDDMVMMVWNVIGLIGEVGEVARLVIDAIHRHQPIDGAALQKELGDVAWYHSAIATRGGLKLGDILAANIAKLQQRYPNGYTSADSMARVDVADQPAVFVPANPGTVGQIDTSGVKCAECQRYLANCTCADDNAVLKTPLGGLLAEIATTFFDGVPVLPVPGNVPGFFHVEVPPLAEDDRLCGGNPDRPHYYGINAEPCDQLCGAYICSACGQMGYTTCAKCCASNDTGGADA